MIGVRSKNFLGILCLWVGEFVSPGFSETVAHAQLKLCGFVELDAT